MASVPEWTDSAPWVSFSYNATGLLPISTGELWAVYTREGHYAVMEITDVADPSQFSFDYKYQPNGTTSFESGGSAGVTPTLSALSLNPSGTTVEVDIAVDITSTLYYVITKSDISPSAEQIIAGTDELDEPADNYNNFGGILGNEVFQLGSTQGGATDFALSEGNTYYIYWVAVNDTDFTTTSEILSGSFTTTVNSQILAYTVEVPGGELVAGSTENLLYEYAFDVSDNNKFLFDL